MDAPGWRESPPPPDLPAPFFGGDIGTAADITLLRGRLHKEVLRRGLPPEADEDDVERLLLAFEELTSNGLRHGLPPVTAKITVGGTGWLLDVADGAADQAPAEAVDRDPALGGLGLYPTAGLGTAHGWCVAGDRKHVWALLPFDGSSAG